MPGAAGRETDALLGGYYRTGDIARRDEDGYITYVGRADDVFPSPDALRLSVPKAFVVVRGEVVASRELALTLFRFVRGRLPRYKRIRCIEFAELPKTISGKIRRVELRGLEVQRRSEGARGELEFWDREFPELREAEESAE